MARCLIYAFWAVVAVGCADGDLRDEDSLPPEREPPPSQPNDDRPDADQALCPAFASPTAIAESYPLEYSGRFGASTESHVEVGPDDCLDVGEYQPSGGPEQVLALRNLLPGQRYAVAMEGPWADRSVYVALGCADGLVQECLAIQDSSVEFLEIVDFVAPESGTAYAIVDTYLNDGTSWGVDTYTLEVHEFECSTDDECAEEAPACVRHRCRECVGGDCASADPDSDLTPVF